MKTKLGVFLGIIAVFTFGVLINQSAHVLAVTTSSSTTSSQSSSLSSSSSKVTASSTAESSSTSQATAKSVVATQDDPPAPTSADGVQNPDWNGSFFMVPIITGFQVQPQSEQYVVADSSGTATTSYDKPDGFLGYIQNGNPKVDNKVTGLAVGTYYIQYEGSFHGWLDAPTFHNDKKISKLVKVVVTAAPVQAKSISITVPKVIFANAAYEGDAVTDPVNATGTISWTGGLLSGANWDGLTWNQQTGRNSNFIVDNAKQPVDVNRETDIPGTPILLAANIDNAAGAGGVANDTKTTYVGGLVAKEMASDEGGTWSLDSGGLKDLEASVNPSSGTNVTWDYQWQYSTDGTGNDSSFEDIPADADGVTNMSGTVSSATELSNTSNVLTFSKTSGFVKNAAAATTSGTDYVVREKLTANVPDQSSDGSGKDQTFEIDSNAASLTVNGATGKLSLDEVPLFNFGKVSASDIYNGTIDSSQTKPEVKTTLGITDTRAGDNDWNLSAKMTRFTNTNSETLSSNSMVQMNDLMGNVSAVIQDDNSSTNVLSSKQGEAGTWNTTGQLILYADPQAQLSNGESFSSTITWNLTSSTITAPKAK